MLNELTNAALSTDTLHIALFEALPGNSFLAKVDAPRFTIVAATQSYLRLVGYNKEDLVGKGTFEAFPPNETDPSNTGALEMLASYNHVLQHKEAHHLPIQRYDLQNKDGSFAVKYWKTTNKPFLSPDGEVVYIIHTTEDITDQVMAEKRESQIKGIEKVFSLFMHAPMVVGLVNGDDYVLEMANEAAFKLWGKGAGIIGKPLLQSLPELQGQGIIELFDQVRTTGRPFFANEVPVTSVTNGKEETHFFNLVYQPYYSEESPKVTGVFTLSFDVTEQVLTRKAAQESEEKYRSLFESMDQGFCVLEMLFDANTNPVDYRFLEINPVFEKQTGLAGAVGKRIKELVPDIEAHWIALYGKVATTGEPVNFIEESKAMGRWFDVYAFRVGDNNSRKVALLFSDITERKKAEEAIRRSEANIRNLVMQSPVAMCILSGPTFKVEIANDRIYEIWGKGPHEMLGRPVFECLPEAGAQGLESIMNHVYTTGERFIANELPVPLPRNGQLETVYINFVYEPFVSDTGAITGVMAVAFEVTDQVLARKKVEESHKEFQFVTDFVPQMIWITRADGYHYYYNKQWYDYTGLTYGETEGEGWNHVFHPDDRERAWKLWRHSLETGALYQIEYRCRRYDGEYRWFLGRALPLKDEQGKIIKWFGTCTDIHDQKVGADLLEHKVEERTREMKEANEQLKQFTYAASHDLQEPLRKISFFIDRLLTNIGPTLSENDKKITERIQHTAIRMRTLIEDLLAYSNTSLGITEFEEINLTETVHGVLDDMEATIIEKGAVLDVEALPTIKGDQRQFRQLLQNLISNALKYHKPGEAPNVQITSKVVRGNETEAYLPEEKMNDPYYLIQVIDNGIGFDADDAERIFRLFQRLHGKAEYEGTGVGLAIVQKVVENHHGHVWAESTPGKGATFNVLLPVA